MYDWNFLSEVLKEASGRVEYRSLEKPEGFGRAWTGVDESTDVHRSSTDVYSVRYTWNVTQKMEASDGFLNASGVKPFNELA